jgi:hypothetical protein
MPSSLAISLFKWPPSCHCAVACVFTGNFVSLAVVFTGNFAVVFTGNFWNYTKFAVAPLSVSLPLSVSSQATFVHRLPLSLQATFENYTK